jgi:hypothetical protein
VLSGVHSLSSEYVVGNNLNVDVFLPIADRLVGFSRAAYYDRRDIPAALAEFEITANVSVFYRDEETHGTFFSAVDELEKQSELWHSCYLTDIVKLSLPSEAHQKMIKRFGKRTLKTVWFQPHTL